jgi:hypothetical protein
MARVFLWGRNNRSSTIPVACPPRLGTIETPFRCENAYHIAIDSKADRETVADGLPRYSAMKT